MKQGWLMLVAGVLVCSAAANAHRSDVDVVLPVSPEIWGAAKGTAAVAPQPCQRCCTYQSQTYSEGAVLKVEGEILQCTRDSTVVGTNPLVWKRLPK
ncbi:DUF1496 domain-containing protein [Serratia sp. NPDC078593]|uniref:DUF1496 domain-containing protein n=1 Tax=unclassified Serratia (in: enterobacteria) TaxID=2647522 RepID=UPI0037D2D469